MADYKVHIIGTDGTVQTRTNRNNPEDFHHHLIALQLVKLHRSTPFQTLLEISEKHACRMGYQTALVDEDYTVVVTELH